MVTGAAVAVVERMMSILPVKKLANSSAVWLSRVDVAGGRNSALIVDQRALLSFRQSVTVVDQQVAYLS